MSGKSKGNVHRFYYDPKVFFFQKITIFYENAALNIRFLNYSIAQLFFIKHFSRIFSFPDLSKVHEFTTHEKETKF